MAIEVPQNEEISGGGRKRVGSAIHCRRASGESAHIKNEGEEKLFSEILTPT